MSKKTRKLLDRLNNSNPQINAKIRAVPVTEDQRADSDDEYRFEISVSSEAPVYRWGEFEILSHEPGAIRLEWIQSENAPFLWMHNHSDPLGIVEKFSIESGRGTAVVRFGKSALAQEKRQEVINGTLVNISIGYRVYAFELVEKAEGEPPTYRVTDWEPKEISLVTVPADTSVGTNRSDEDDEPDQTRTQQLQIETKERNMDKYLKELARKYGMNENSTPDAILKEHAKRCREEGRQDAIDENTRENARRDSIAQIGRECNLEGDAKRYIDDDKSVDEFRSFALQKLREGHTPVKTASDLSPSERKDLERFSMRRFVLGCYEGRHEGIESEMLQEGADEAKRSGVKVVGSYAPFMALQMGRSMTAGSAESAGNLIPTQRLSYIDSLKAKLWLTKLGVNYMGGLSGNIEIPRITNNVEGEVIGETGALTPQDITTDLVTLTPKRIGASGKLSLQLLRQGSPDVDVFIENQQQSGIARKLNAQCIVGLGTGNEVLGIVNVNGVYAVIMGDNGAELDWAKLIEFQTGIEDANADLGTLGYLTSTKVKGALRTTQKVSGQAEMLWIGQPGNDVGHVAECNAVATGLVPSDGTKGSGTGLSTMIAGYFGSMHVGQWGGIDVVIQREKYADTGEIGIVTNGYFGTAYDHPECFAVADDIVTP